MKLNIFQYILLSSLSHSICQNNEQKKRKPKIHGSVHVSTTKKKEENTKQKRGFVRDKHSYAWKSVGNSHQSIKHIKQEVCVH